MAENTNNKVKKCIILGNAFLEKGYVEHAITEYKRGLEITPDDIELICKIGTVYFNCGEVDKAIEEYQKALLIDEGNGDVHHLLGTAYYEKGQLQKAEREYKIALRIYPNFASLYNNLAVIYTEEGKIEKAEELYKKAVELSPEDATFHSNLGVIFSQKGLKKEAEEEFLKALRLNPNEITAHYCLGMEVQHKGTLEVGQILKIGSLLKIQPTFSMKLKDYQRIYSTRIEEVGEDTITVGAPIYKGVVIPLRPGQQLIAGISQKDALYGFYTEIVDRGKINELPVIRIRKGKESKRIQRRKHVRINGISRVDIKILKKEEDNLGNFYFDKRKIREKNISGGGMLIVSPQKLPTGTIMEINITLPYTEPIRTMGKVIRALKMEDEYEIGISFMNIAEKDREKIIKYVYQRQVELKKLGF